MITTLAGGRVLAEKFGSTPPRVVALHGWGRDGSDFATILSGLDAVSIHLPGFGPAPAPDDVWGTERYAELVADAIAAYAPVVMPPDQTPPHQCAERWVWEPFVSRNHRSLGQVGHDPVLKLAYPQGIHATPPPRTRRCTWQATPPGWSSVHPCHRCAWSAHVCAQDAGLC